MNRTIAVPLLPSVLALTLAVVPTTGQSTWLASRTPAGSPGNGHSSSPAVTPDGRYVAFSSASSDLVPGDTNGVADVFVFDRQTGAVERVSTGSANEPGNGASITPAISADGRFVAFSSFATNFSTFNTHSYAQVYRKDRQTGVLAGISIRVSFPTSSWGNGPSGSPTISANGSVVAFETAADNFVAGDTNARIDIYARVDGSLAPTRITEVSIQGQYNGHSRLPRISANGRYVAYQSSASNIVWNDNNNAEDVFVHDRITGGVDVASGPGMASGSTGNGASWSADLSDDGGVITFTSIATNLVPGDTNAAADVFVRDLNTRTTTRASVTSDGQQALSGGLLPAGSTECSCSGDARFVAFRSDANNLGGPGPHGVYVRDRTAGRTWYVSAGTPLPAEFQLPRLARQGSHVVFAAGPSASAWQVYVRDWPTPGSTSPYGTACRGSIAGANVLPGSGQARFLGGADGSVLTSGPSRFQQVFLGTELPEPLTITGIAFRQSVLHAGDVGGAVDLEVKVGYTTFGLSNLSPTFATNFNLGPPVTVLPRTVITLPAMPPSPPSDPTVMMAEIPFSTSFSWQPLGFNLLIEIVKRTPAPFAYRVDAASAPIASTTLVGAPDTATTGTLAPRFGPAIALRAANGALPVLIGQGSPIIGLDFPLHLRQGRPASAAVFFLGASNTAWGALTLPLPLAILGAARCQLLAAPDLTLTQPTSAAGSATVPVPIPFDPATLGLSFFAQSAVLDPAANSLGLAFTQGLSIRRGNN